MKESELAKLIIYWLEYKQWDIYQEVLIGSRVADIVAKKNDILWIIECKNSLNLQLLEQGHNWIDYGDYVSLAYPKSVKYNRSNIFAKKIARDYDMGCIEVNVKYKYLKHKCVSESIKPVLLTNNNLKDNVNLYKEQKKYKNAGCSGGGYYSPPTPFQNTIKLLNDYVNNNNGIHIKKVISDIEHHYKNDKSAIGSIKQYIKNGVIKDLKIIENKLYTNE